MSSGCIDGHLTAQKFLKEGDSRLKRRYFGSVRELRSEQRQKTHRRTDDELFPPTQLQHGLILLFLFTMEAKPRPAIKERLARVRRAHRLRNRDAGTSGSAGYHVHLIGTRERADSAPVAVGNSRNRGNGHVLRKRRTGRYNRGLRSRQAIGISGYRDFRVTAGKHRGGGRSGRCRGGFA